MSSRKEQKERARHARLAREAELKAATRRKRLLTRIALAVAAAAVAAVIAIASGGSGASAGVGQHASTPRLELSGLAALGALRPPGALGSVGPEGVPIPDAPVLANTSSMASGGAVDGAQCLGAEQTLFHIHAHLTVFVAGAARQIPYGIGITSAQAQSTPQGEYVGNGGCFYWLHTHAADGIIHIESPVRRTFTLGDFFDVWGQPLSSRRVGPASGRVTAIYNGKLYHGDPRDIPLNAHAQIQLEVGTPLVAPVSVSFPGGL